MCDCVHVSMCDCVTVCAVQEVLCDCASDVMADMGCMQHSAQHAHCAQRRLMHAPVLHACRMRIQLPCTRTCSACAVDQLNSQHSVPRLPPPRCGC